MRLHLLGQTDSIQEYNDGVRCPMCAAHVYFHVAWFSSSMWEGGVRKQNMYNRRTTALMSFKLTGIEGIIVVCANMVRYCVKHPNQCQGPHTHSDKAKSLT